jgi:5-methylcytosine-specific restriction endonuclease McrA
MAYKTKEDKLAWERQHYAKNPHLAKEKQAAKRERNRQIIYEHCGCECCKCRSRENLEFDHINPALKTSKQSFLAIGKGDLLNQIDNIQVLCHTCHKAKSTAQKNAAWKLFSSLSLEKQEQLIKEFL